MTLKVQTLAGILTYKTVKPEKVLIKQTKVLGNFVFLNICLAKLGFQQRKTIVIKCPQEPTIRQRIKALAGERVNLITELVQWRLSVITILVSTLTLRKSLTYANWTNLTDTSYKNSVVKIKRKGKRSSIDGNVSPEKYHEDSNSEESKEKPKKKVDCFYLTLLVIVCPWWLWTNRSDHQRLIWNHTTCETYQNA